MDHIVVGSDGGGLLRIYVVLVWNHFSIHRDLVVRNIVDYWMLFIGQPRLLPLDSLPNHGQETYVATGGSINK